MFSRMAASREKARKPLTVSGTQIPASRRTMPLPSHWRNFARQADRGGRTGGLDEISTIDLHGV
jgi:alpha-D-ribose 1-methylphosphonate 5-phosphate C-P lyase